MEKKKTISLDGDTIEVKFSYDAECDVWHGEYPDFIESPRYTPNGRPWVDVTKDDCPYSTGEYGDCGDCMYLIKQNDTDLIGICTCDSTKVATQIKEAIAK